MRLVDIEVVGRRIPFANEFPVSYGSDDSTEHVFIRIHTNTEHVGYGEGTALPWFTGEVTAGMVEIIERWLGPRIEGKLLDEALLEVSRFLDAYPGTPGAKSAVELALLDLKGKRVGVPMADLLGPQVHDRIPLVYVLPALSPDRAAERAQDAVIRGFRHFKVKADGDVAPDADRINAVLTAIPDEATLRVDANTGWKQLPRAIQAVEAIEETSKIEYIEQPVAADRTADMRALWERTGIPVYADESVHGPSDVERLGNQSLVAGCHLKLAKTGSLLRLAKMASTARRHGLTVSTVSAFGTSVEAAANLHLAAVTENASSGIELCMDLIAEDPTVNPIEMQPEVDVPSEPGLGVRLDNDLF